VTSGKRPGRWERRHGVLGNLRKGIRVASPLAPLVGGLNQAGCVGNWLVELIYIKLSNRLCNLFDSLI
jgi:hypothetical protein